MFTKMNLSGLWNFELDEDKIGKKLPFNDTITLPGTTSNSKKGKRNESVELGFLTDEYKFEGHAWFSKEIEISEELALKKCSLHLERTRVTTVWIDDVKIGTQNSLCTPHCYDLSNQLSAGKHTITILVDNTDYPTKGGHLTSPDTQTNWNGITGKIELQFFNKSYLTDIQVYPEVATKSIWIKAKVEGTASGTLSVSAVSFNGSKEHTTKESTFTFSSNEINIKYLLGEDALLWSEYEPNLYNLKLTLFQDGSEVDTSEVTFGLREFKALGDKFTINGVKTFLRGKHDGLIFPLTGFAPTTVEEWLEVLKISKSYGINHYRFHTCCPPEAAFIAADILGIYMEPELPFWGTITDENDENHDQAQQDYLINEGFLMLRNFGNHPSFVMMSLGNELWGSSARMDVMLKGYKEFDNRHLYTEGSNNFQFCPVILENDDFLCGVRFSKDRLYRGSYAMCDAPLGHVQTAVPGTMKDYDQNIHPNYGDMDETNSTDSSNTIEIQFGTEAKTVKATEYNEKMIPNVPVISHEIGQYATFPNFKEIDKYNGSLKARNFEAFRERLVEKGLEDLSEKYFMCSGKLAVECYKEELEAAFRSKKLAGFQILDIQDFSGQGTALVGILDAFMDSKGTVTPEEWRTFCSDSVLMARFLKYNYSSLEEFDVHVELCYYKDIPLKNIELSWQLRDDATIIAKGNNFKAVADDKNYIDICDINIKMPETQVMKKLTLELNIDKLGTKKTYDLWLYPQKISVDKAGLNIFNDLSSDAINLLQKGEKIILFPQIDKIKNSIEGFYCTDFWCYPMFRSISESMNRAVPVGTMGLLINNAHPVFKNFISEEYSTYQWWNIVSNSRSIILDQTPKDFRPIVQTIDNFERNHKLGLLFECNVLNGKVLVCSCDIDKIINLPEGKQFLNSIFSYVSSADFKPKSELSISQLEKLFE